MVIIGTLKSGRVYGPGTVDGSPTVLFGFLLLYNQFRPVLLLRHTTKDLEKFFEK